LAVVGEVALTLDGKEVAANRVVPFASGQRLVLGPLRRGLRAYVAVAGGLAVPQVLASSSTDQLSGTGPGVLRSGDEIGFGRPDGPMGDHLAPGTSSDEETVLRVLEGPHGRWFAEDAMARLSARRFVVGQASNRVGTRLEGLEAGGGIDRLAEELPSQGMVTGAVQVPPDGMPVVLGPDHGVLGGYPVLAVVIQADLGRLGQCRPGQGVRLVPIDRAEAADAAFRLRRFLGEAVVGRYPVQPA
jgi:biotin-dependent carboxylase-like uncharacterized protein